MGQQVTGQAQGLILASSQKSGSPAALSTGFHNELLVSELLPRYTSLVLAGVVKTLDLVTAAAITSYAGAAAGTPMLAGYNPAQSNKNVVLLLASVGVGAAGSVAGTDEFGIWWGPSAAAITAAVNATPHDNLSGSANSVVQGFANTALTGASAATNFIPLLSYYWATAAGAVDSSGAPIDLGGLIIVPPGSFFALGGIASAATAATFNGSITYAEIPL